MTPEPLRFALVRYVPDLQRQESVNIGAVLFLKDGPVVSMASNQGKLLALDPNLPIARVFEQVRRLGDALRATWQGGVTEEELVGMFSAGASLVLSPLGTIVPEHGQSPTSVLDELLRELVHAPTRRRVREAQVSRLNTELRQVFRQARILGSKPSDIARHLVVPGYPIDAETGLFAEFALRNGKLHVTETVDFRISTPSSKKQEAQAKTLILVEALERVGSSDLRRYVVVSGASVQMQASINLLAKYSDDLIVRESEQDWRRYVDAMHSAAKPHGDPLQ